MPRLRILSATAALAAVWLAALLPGLPARAAPTPLVRDGVPPTDAAVAASLPRYLQGRSAHFVDWLADGSLLIATRFGDTWQIHQVRAPLGMRAQLSFEPAGVLAAAVQPFSSDTLVYLAAGAGASGRGTQLILEQLRDHSLRALSDGSDRISQPTWSPDGGQLAFVSDRRGVGDADVYVLDTRAPGAAARLVAAGIDGAGWRIEGWSPDARHLLLARAPAAAALGAGDAGVAGAPDNPAAETALYIADLEQGSVAPLQLSPEAGGRGSGRGRRARAGSGRPARTDDSATLRAVDARYAPDGRGILLLTRALADGGPGALAHEYLHLSLLDPASGRWRELSAPAAYDVGLFDESADGRYLAYTLDQNGQSRLMLIDQQLQLQRPVASVPTGIISSLRFDASGRHLALTLESSRSPADVYVLDLATQALTRWTQSEAGPLPAGSFIEPQVLSFPTWDSIDGQPRRLQVLVYDPGPQSPGSQGPRPVLIWLCSGAGSQCRPGYAPFIQYLAHELGVVVMAPNVRGSSGFGANLLAAGEGELRDDAPRDVGALLAWIGLQPGLDRSRVALFGEGYGGYLALQSLSEYSDRLRGAVVAFPPPLADLLNVAAIRAAVLLVQAGDAGDAPGYEVAQLREGLRSQGVKVQYLAAAGADAFDQRRARDAYHAAAASFLARLLR
ncbi:MAG TPA: prolyl oligopeptidase family serine peptidase [Steroidobacteraceae bacterium]|nr:prolyl oligopeptidase family serine peptidase [Steroidobacteraceae bacterium]